MNKILLIINYLYIALVSIIGSPTQYTVDRYLENAVYYEQTMMWITPKNDPYTLENFQNAYNNLSSGNTLLDFTSLQLVEFRKERKLKPTHYSKNLDQQYKLTAMKDITTSSIPYDYTPLLGENAKKAEDMYRANKPLFLEEPIYKIRYSDYNKADTTTFDMAVMYVVWPVGKKKPRRIKCKKCYDVFIPDYQKHTRSLSLSREALEILELEATAIAARNDEMNIFLYHD